MDEKGLEFPEAYLETPDREMRLEAETGQRQPEVTGAWLRENCPPFTYATTSDHVRAYETAGRLGLGISWHIDPLYGERHWGTIDQESSEARNEFYELRRRDPMFATPPRGERLIGTRLRARVLLERGARQHTFDNFLAVLHGEMIEAILCELLHLATEEFKDFRESELGKMGNCQVVEFSRRRPNGKGFSYRYEFIRTSNPYLEEFGDWVHISELSFSRASFKEAELIERAERYPSLYC